MSSTSVLIEWTEPEDPNGVLTGYEIDYRPIYNHDDPQNERKGRIETLDTEEDEFQAKLSDLEEETLYEISIYAMNGAGRGVE